MGLSDERKRKETKMITLTKAEKMAKNANINGVAAFIKDHGKEYDRVTIEVMKETLMESYLAEIRDFEMDRHIFSNIRRIANL